MSDRDSDADGDSESKPLYIDEREEPPSPKRQRTSDNQNTSTENISSESNTKPSEPLNVRNHSAELPPVNANNLLNANEGVPRITIKKIACISDASTSNENEDSDFLDNKISNLADFEPHMAIAMNNKVLRAEPQNKDPRLRRATAATVYKRSARSHMNTLEDQRVILQNPFEVQIEKIPHMPSAPSMDADRQAGAIVPSSGNHLGGAMPYGPPPSTQRHNGVNTNFHKQTAITHVLPAQNGHQPQIHTDAFTVPYSYNNGLAEYYEQASTYNQRAPPPICQMNTSAHSSNHQQVYSMGMTYNEQRLASANRRLKSVPMNRQNFSWNGYESGPNFVPQHYPYTDRHIASDFAKMQLNNFNFKSMQSMRTEAAYVVSTSGHVNKGAEVKPTIKSAHTYTQIAMITNSEIPGGSTYNNVRGSGAGLVIPNRDASRKACARKRAAKPNTNTLKAKASLPVKNQVHDPSNMRIPTRNNIEIRGLDLTSACIQPSMNNIPILTQLPLNTGANMTTMRTKTPKGQIITVSHYIDVAQAPMCKNGNLHSAVTYINNDGAPNVLVEASDGAVNINLNRDSAQIPLIMDQQTDMNLNIIKSTTSDATEIISHNKESNAVLTSASINAETDAVQGIAKANPILKTVDHRIETRLTTVGDIDEIINRPIEYFLNILNNVQRSPTKTPAIDDKTKHDNNKVIAHTTIGDHNEARIDHEPQVIIVSEPELEIARKKLERWNAIERKTPRDTENQYQIKIPTDVYGEYIEQVIKEHFIDFSPIRTEQINLNNNNNISLFQRRQETAVLERHTSIKSSESRENIMNTTRDEAKGKIHESIEFEAPVRMVSNNSETNTNAAQRDDATENSTNERQSYSHVTNNKKDGRDSRQTENWDLENQLSLITTGLPLSPKEAEIDDQARASVKHVLDDNRTTQDGNTKDSVVKIPTNMLKESTVKALFMQRINVKSNTVRTEAATGTNPATQDRKSNPSRDSQDNNNNLDKHRKTPRENEVQSGDNATRVTEEVINNSRNTLKKNCISNEEELPQVKIPERKQKDMITKEKKNKSNGHELCKQKTEFTCPKCSVNFSYRSRCLRHMKDNHSIENPEPIERILCPFCGAHVWRESYNNHIKTAHKDIYNSKPNKPKKVIFKINTEVVWEKYI